MDVADDGDGVVEVHEVGLGLEELVDDFDQENDFFFGEMVVHHQLLEECLPTHHEALVSEVENLVALDDLFVHHVHFPFLTS